MTPSLPTASPVLPRHLYGILGMPLGHSLSPLLHNWAFCRMGHPGAYFAWEKSREELPGFFSAVRVLPVAGLSVTIPHKQAVIEFLDILSPGADAVGAVNTIYWRDGKLCGDNTDVTGFLAPLTGMATARELRSMDTELSVCSSETTEFEQEKGSFNADIGQRNSLKATPRALLLGGGGVSRAALAGLRELGVTDITVAVRNPDKAQALADDFQCSVIPWEQREKAAADQEPLLVINATSLGMRGENEGKSPLPDSFWHSLRQNDNPASCTAYELIYSPIETPFLRQARSVGCNTLDGLSFFMAQAAEQFRLWTGSTWPASVAAEARRLVEAHL